MVRWVWPTVMGLFPRWGIGLLPKNTMCWGTRNLCFKEKLLFFFFSEVLGNYFWLTVTGVLLWFSLGFLTKLQSLGVCVFLGQLAIFLPLVFCFVSVSFVVQFWKNACVSLDLLASKKECFCSKSLLPKSDLSFEICINFSGAQGPKRGGQQRHAELCFF